MFIFDLGRDVYSTGSVGIFKLHDDTWKYEHARPGGTIAGEANNLMITTGDSLFHYNGNTWQDITPPECRDALRGSVGNVILIHNMWYFTASLSYKTVIFRGIQQ